MYGIISLVIAMLMMYAKDDIEVKYKNLLIEYVIETDNVPIHMFFKIGEFIDIEGFLHRISHFTSMKEDMLKPYAKFFVNYFNEVMKKSFVRWGL